MFPQEIEKQLESYIDNLIDQMYRSIPCVDCDYVDLGICIANPSGSAAISCVKCGVCLDVCMMAGELAPVCAVTCSIDCGNCVVSVGLNAVKCINENCHIGRLGPCTNGCKPKQ